MASSLLGLRVRCLKRKPKETESAQEEADNASFTRITAAAGVAFANSEVSDQVRVLESIDMLDEPFRSKALVSVVEVLVRLGNFNHAREIVFAISIRQHGWRAVAFALIYHYSCDEQDLERAEYFLGRVEPFQKKEAIQNYLSDLVAKDSCAQISVVYRQGSVLAFFPDDFLALLDCEE